MVKLLLIVCYFMCAAGFVVDQTRTRQAATTTLFANNQSWNPFQEVSDMMANFDDVIDDFLNKRMGNGEIFYGQRKYKPSGRENTTGQYTGMGMSDKAKIDFAREVKEQRMEMKRLREQGLNRSD